MTTGVPSPVESSKTLSLAMSNTPVSNEVLAERMAAMQVQFQSVTELLKNINTSLAGLVRIETDQRYTGERVQRLEERQETFDKDFGTRLETIERQLPGLVEIRRWVIGGILAALTALGAALFQSVLVTPKQTHEQLLEVIKLLEKSRVGAPTP